MAQRTARSLCVSSVVAACALTIGSGVAVSVSISTSQAAGQTAPEQPVPFSHQRHLAQGLDCRGCHEVPEPGDAATLPSTSTCMVCHEALDRNSPALAILSALHEAGQPVAWKRVYQLPSFVFFSHKRHVEDAATPCETCHGPVREMEVMRKVKETTMASCVECHQEKRAPTGCDICHDPR